MQENTNIISKFSKHLFWDVNSSDLDLNTHSKYIISKVLQYGNYSDWKALLSFYGLDTIVKKAQSIRELDKRTAAFLSALGDVPKTSFQCFSTKQSIPKHWVF